MRGVGKRGIQGKRDWLRLGIFKQSEPIVKLLTLSRYSLWT